MALPLIGAALEFGLKLIDKAIPDPQAKAAAKLRLMELEQHGELKEMETSLSAIIAEAQSSDPYTSRARPSFLYVVYVLLLSSIPMGVLFAFSPETAANITTGFKGWLSAIPEPIITLFGVGYLGYTGARSWDKSKQRI